MIVDHLHLKTIRQFISMYDQFAKQMVNLFYLYLSY